MTTDPERVTGADGGALPELPPRIVGVAYVIAVVCVIVPFALLGAIFAGIVVFTRGRRRAGAGVIAVALLCTALGMVVLR